MNMAKTALWALAAAALLCGAAVFSAEKKAEKIIMVTVIWNSADDSYEAVDAKTVEGRMKITKPTAQYGVRQHWVVRLLDSKGNVLFEQSLKDQPYVTVPPPDETSEDDGSPKSVKLQKVSLLLRAPLIAGAYSLVLYARINTADKPTTAKNFANDYAVAAKIAIENAK